MNKRNLCSSVFFIFFAVFVTTSSIRLGIGQMNNPQPGFLPFTTSFILIIICVIMFIVNFRQINSALHVTASEQDTRWLKSIIVVSSLIIYIPVLTTVGYIPATLALMFVLFISAGLKTWPAIISSMLAVFFSYGLFQIVLKIPLPRAMWIL